MLFHTTESVCALTGASLSNLRRWQHHGLVTIVPGEKHWSSAQLSEIRTMMLVTAGGVTSREISFSMGSIEPIKSFGWLARRGEILLQLESGTYRDMVRVTRNLSRDFSGDDFINQLMKPLVRWLRADEREGAARRLNRFRHLIKYHCLAVGRISYREGCVPLLLEIAPGLDETDALLEVIRLTGQGFCVDIYENSCGSLPEAIFHCYDHHMLWSSDGKSQAKLTCA